MFCGERWFKFRHLDEDFINDQLETLFRTRVPNHRPGGPQSGEAPERRTYTPGVEGHAGTLTASEEHVPLPLLEPVEEQRRTWLEPVLRIMLPAAPAR